MVACGAVQRAASAPQVDWRQAFPSWARERTYGVALVVGVLILAHVLVLMAFAFRLGKQPERPKEELQTVKEKES